MTSKEKDNSLIGMESVTKPGVSIPAQLCKSDKRVLFTQYTSGVDSQGTSAHHLPSCSSNHMVEISKLNNAFEVTPNQESATTVKDSIEHSNRRPMQLKSSSELRLRAGGPKKSHRISCHKKDCTYPTLNPPQIRIHSCHPATAGSDKCRKCNESSEIIYRYHHSLEKDFVTKERFCNCDRYEIAESRPCCFSDSFFENQNAAAAEIVNETSDILPINESEPTGFFSYMLYNEDPDAATLEKYLNVLWDDIRKQFSVELESVILDIKNRCREEYTAVIDKITLNTKRVEEEVELQKEQIEFQEILLKQKGKITDNLSDALFKFQDRFLLAQAFSTWKVKFIQQKHLSNLDNIASRLYLNKLRRKAFKTWHDLIRKNWKDRIQHHCQNRAEIVCQELVDEYEKKMAMLTEELESTRSCNKKIQNQLDDQKDLMKRALLRGVCALNLEAMNVFSSTELFQQIDSALCKDYLPNNENHNIRRRRATNCEYLSIPETDQESVTPQKTTRDENSTRSPCVNSRQSTLPSCRKSQNSSPPVKVVRNNSLPFGSVSLPERYKPVNKQTLGQNFAARHTKAAAASTQTSNFQDTSQQTSSISIVSQTKKNKRNSQ